MIFSVDLIDTTMKKERQLHLRLARAASFHMKMAGVCLITVRKHLVMKDGG